MFKSHYYKKERVQRPQNSHKHGECSTSLNDNQVTKVTKINVTIFIKYLHKIIFKQPLVYGPQVPTAKSQVQKEHVPEPQVPVAESKIHQEPKRPSTQNFIPRQVQLSNMRAPVKRKICSPSTTKKIVFNNPP